MSYLSKVITTVGIAASATIIGTVSASADSVTVKSGDTLNKIAEANNTDADTLASINHIQNKNLIYVGDVIELSASTNTQNVTTTAPAQTQTYSQTTSYTASVTPVQAATQASTSSNSAALNALIARESGGNTGATNGQYYGIGQLSAQARAIYGGNSSDYNDQLNAMKSYITARYGSAENAWAHSQATGWY